MEDLLLIGVIAGAFGIKGQVKLKSFTDRPEHICRHIHKLYIGKRTTEYRLVRAFEHKPGVLILTLDGVADRDAAEAMRGDEVYIPSTAAAPLASDEYFLHDLTGVQAFTTDGTSIGTVKDVLVTGASDILVISRPGQPDALVPMVREFIRELDLPAQRIVIQPIEGML
jgi:16S rRNA processing protein RimM